MHEQQQQQQQLSGQLREQQHDWVVSKQRPQAQQQQLEQQLHQTGQQQHQQARRQQQHCWQDLLRLSSPFWSALDVPFLILPNIMPSLNLDSVIHEATLKRDVIYLTNANGDRKAVCEARSTGWQSDIGATFCYSGKEMVPAKNGLTPIIAQVIAKWSLRYHLCTSWVLYPSPLSEWQIDTGARLLCWRKDGSVRSRCYCCCCIGLWWLSVLIGCVLWLLECIVLCTVLLLVLAKAVRFCCFVLCWLAGRHWGSVCYSGKQVVPLEKGFTPLPAQVAPVLLLLCTHAVSLYLALQRNNNR
eukprot:GHRR01036735.1.p1 GENE.GHRR01036735.1~~GHRR01036735.1.p1  ORF type:complete len:333 (+),score=96.16 GHRR01036735.1:102-1001(+)